MFLGLQFYHSSHFAIEGAVKSLRSQRAKPDQSLYLSLLYLVKTPPYSDYFSNSEYVLEAFCSLLKRDVKESYKSKGTFKYQLIKAYQENQGYMILLDQYVRQEIFWAKIGRCALKKAICWPFCQLEHMDLL